MTAAIPAIRHRLERFPPPDQELESAGPRDVMLLGDMNDAVGLDEWEPQGGGDAIMNLVGPPEGGFILVTKPLADAKEHSFGGYWRDRHRELIDHVIVTRSLQPRIVEVKVVDNVPFARVASDHYPVMIKIKAD